MQSPFKFCACRAHRDHITFADAVGSAEHIKRGRVQAGQMNSEGCLDFVLGLQARD